MSFSCKHCDQTFEVFADLGGHMLSVHRKPQPAQPCPKCRKAFTGAPGMRMHLKFCQGFVYSCSRCDQKFSCKRDLVTHMQDHAEEPWTCPSCSKSFPNIASCQGHKRFCGVVKAEPNKRPKTGWRHTEEARKRMSLVQCGRLFSLVHRMRLSTAHTGKVLGPYPQWRVENVRKALLGKYVGPKSSNWMGGVSFLPYPVDFNGAKKRQVYARDGHICQLCDALEDLTIHHIDYVKDNVDLSNLIVLCRSCNGKVNKARKYWTGYFQGLLRGLDGSSSDVNTKHEEAR